MSSTPALDRLLERLRRRLVAQVWLHGLGRAAAYGCAWLLLAYLIDRTLHVPSFVRALHFGVLVGLPVFAVWRELIRPLRRIPDRAGLAVLLERAHPQSELFVSAVQLDEARLTPGEERELAAAMIARVRARAEERAAGVALDGAVDPRPVRRSLAAGLGAAALLAVVLLSDRPASAIFLQRLLGGGPRWPQRTHLSVEVPLAEGRAQVEHVGDELRVQLARGGDVPVVVRADGVAPDDVTLHFDGGHRDVLGPTGKGVYRTLLRSLQEDIAFHVTGGDDEDGLPRVVVEVLQPPEIAGLAVRIEPPAYSGLPTRLERDRDVEVLAGSRVGVHVLPVPAEARGIARLLPDDLELALEERPFPVAAPEAPAEGAAPAAPPAGLAFDLVAESDLRYRFELVDGRGLSNPDPGLFAIHVVPDRPPQIELLAPTRAEVETVVGGALPLRTIARDDFRVAALGLEIAQAGSDQPPEVVELATRAVDDVRGDEERDAERAPAASERFAARRVEASELAGGRPPVEGQLFTLAVVARDNHEPVAQEARSAPVRVRVISADELHRRVQDRLARVRQQASGLSELTRERTRRTNELIAAMASDDTGGGADTAELAAALGGQRRVQGDARALARELVSITQSLLYTRLDERAGALLDALDATLAEHADRTFHAEPWRALARRAAAGEFEAAALAGRLVVIVGLALEVSEDDARVATEELRGALEAENLAAVLDALAKVSELQASTGAKLERLLELLAEWDNLQSVLSLTRDILNRQKNLLERTKVYAKEN